MVQICSRDTPESGPNETLALHRAGGYTSCRLKTPQSSRPLPTDAHTIAINPPKLNPELACSHSLPLPSEEGTTFKVLKTLT